VFLQNKPMLRTNYTLEEKKEKTKERGGERKRLEQKGTIQLYRYKIMTDGIKWVTSTVSQKTVNS
jgi:hypothetical protein